MYQIGEKAGTRFPVPAHNQTAMAKISPVLTREEWTELFASGDTGDEAWIPDENRRKQSYRDLIAAGSRSGLLQQIRILYRHKKAQTAAGRKVHICDENFLRDAERLLTGELAVAFALNPEEARELLRRKAKEDA